MKTVSAIKLVNTNDPTYNKLTVGEGGNRTPTDRSVLRLATSIGNCNLLEYRPILVKKETKRKVIMLSLMGKQGTWLANI